MTKKVQNTSGRASLALILFLLLIAVVASFFTYNFRIINTTGGIHVVEKSDPAFDKPYVDISHWGIKELFRYRNITYEVIRAGHGSEIPQIALFRHAADQGVSSAKEFDERYDISTRVTEGYEWTVARMQELDKQYEIRGKMDAAIDEANRIDEEYGISEGVKEGMDDVSDAARELMEKAKND